GLEGRANHAVHTGRCGQVAEARDLVPHGKQLAVPDLLDACRREGRENRDREDPGTIAARSLRGRLEHLRAARRMHGEQVHAVRRGRLDGAGDRTRDVVELQVQEDALPARSKLPEQWGPGPGEEWGSDFVPANRVAQSIDEPQGFLARGEVERNDEVGHVFSNLPVQPTRPAPISSLRSAMPATSP